ncbi:MAG: NAD-dependent epimerase/dehydratase family protein, partial [bacterium]|nr:NAD-dependent epimerase/dehydratase family protein [bacterium]
MSGILVTGGAGFIGGAIARRLIEQRESVTILDDLSTARRENIPEKARFIEGSLSSPATLDRLSGEGIDTVFHLGAQSSGEVSHADPLGDFDINARGTFLLLRWCERQGIERFLYASSMAV